MAHNGRDPHATGSRANFDGEDAPHGKACPACGGILATIGRPRAALGDKGDPALADELAEAEAGQRKVSEAVAGMTSVVGERTSEWAAFQAEHRAEITGRIAAEAVRLEQDLAA